MAFFSVRIMQKLRKPAVEFCLYISEGKKKKIER